MRIKMAHVVVEDNKLVYRKMFKTCSIDVNDIVWAYLQQEDASAGLCCGTASFPIGRLIVLDSHGSKEIFQYEGLEEPKDLLGKLKDANPSMAVGYTEENRARYEMGN
jgi:hypothetical protein